MRISWHAIVVALVVIGVALVAIALFGFAFYSPRALAPTAKAEMTQCGDTVYYFGGAYDFGTALAGFSKSHPELRVVAVAPLDTGVGGTTIGYWVVVEKDPEKEKR